MRVIIANSRPDDRQGCRSCASSTGFTLLELVIVLLVMSIFAAAAVPKFVDSLLFYRVESAARRVKADLELVRHTARTMSKAQTFTVSGFTYTATADVKSLDAPNQAYVVDLSKSPFYLDTVTANFNSLPNVTFDGYGTPSSGGTVVLKIRDHICTVTLDAPTGQVAISSNHPGGRTAAVN